MAHEMWSVIKGISINKTLTPPHLLSVEVRLLVHPALSLSWGSLNCVNCVFVNMIQQVTIFLQQCLILKGVISHQYEPHQASSVSLLSVGTSCTSQSVCIYLSTQSDRPLCRQLPMTTVRYALISEGKLGCEGREHQGHMSGWAFVVIQRIHWGVTYKMSCLIMMLLPAPAVWSSCFLLFSWIWFLCGQCGHACFLIHTMTDWTILMLVLWNVCDILYFSPLVSFSDFCYWCVCSFLLS